MSALLIALLSVWLLLTAWFFWSLYRHDAKERHPAREPKGNEMKAQRTGGGR